MNWKQFFFNSWVKKLFWSLFFVLSLYLISQTFAFSLLNPIGYQSFVSLVRSNLGETWGLLIFIIIFFLFNQLWAYPLSSSLFWFYKNVINKPVSIKRPIGLRFFCLSSFIGLPLIFIILGGPIGFLLWMDPFLRMYMLMPFLSYTLPQVIFGFYLAYNLWNFKKRSIVLLKIWAVLSLVYPIIFFLLINYILFDFQMEFSIFIFIINPWILIWYYYFYKKRQIFVN